MICLPLIITAFSNLIVSDVGQIDDNQLSVKNFDFKSSLPPENYEWWNKSWDFRVPLTITALGAHQDAPVEMSINFTEYFNDLNVANPILNTSSIRVVEYTTSSEFFEVESQFDPYTQIFNNQTNAVGDLIWVLNGTTINNQVRDFYIYFNNGSKPEVYNPNYDIIRVWHEGFENFQLSNLLSGGGSQDSHPDSWDISISVAARGDSSLHIYGNCWKALSTGVIDTDVYTVVTAKMRFDDPDLVREISGLGFNTIYTSIPASQNSYRIRGNQNWGTAGSNKYANQYYNDDTFFWYTFNVDSEISLSTFSYIFAVADDDSFNSIDLYWDDISIWAKNVQTTPNNTLQTTLGDVQPISFTMKVTCLDEEGNPVPNADIFLSNDLDSSLNQNHSSDNNGEWLFTDIKSGGSYNITVNYTQQGIDNPITATVYSNTNYVISDLNSYVIAYLNLTHIYFNITDKDANPIENGYVLLKEGGTIDVGKAILNSFGLGSIIWINGTNYDYTAYFDYASLSDQSSYKYDEAEIASSSVLIGNHNINIVTEIVKVQFNVTDNTPERVPFANAKLRIYNQTDYGIEANILANITVLPDGSAEFFSFSNETGGGWGNYTLETYFGGDLRNFVANSQPIWDNYNFTFSTGVLIDIRIELDMNKFNSSLNFINILSENYWGNQIYIEFNFTIQDESHPTPTLRTPDELYAQILDDEQDPFSSIVSIKSAETATGIFNYTFNTNTFDLLGGTRYWIKITGNYKNYISPDPIIENFRVTAIPTGLKVYNYSLIELTDLEISQFYAEKVNVSVRYYNSFTDNPLLGATLSYEWDYGSGSIDSDPMHPNYYYFEINTANSPNFGKYKIDISAQYTNYSTLELEMDINIMSRPTTINDTTSFYQISPQIYILESVNFTFEYEDMLTTSLLSNLDIASFNWYRLDNQGDPMSGPNNEGTGSLVEDSNKRYILDFDTESRETGEYTIYITLQKDNYQVKNAFISLSIINRPMAITFDATNLVGKEINIVKGTVINFNIVLRDFTNLSMLLSNANVSLYIDNVEYEFSEDTPGYYSVDFTTSHIDAFFMPQTLTNCYIQIDMDYYESEPITLVIIVGMDEIFPGFPMFYFLMIVGAAIAVVGSLVAYRTIQQARIPTFVKKAREMSKNIKGRKSIPDSILYPTKEEYVVKELGDKWEMLGLSLVDILGVERKKGKKLPEIPESKGGKM